MQHVITIPSTEYDSQIINAADENEDHLQKSVKSSF